MRITFLMGLIDGENPRCSEECVFIPKEPKEPCRGRDAKLAYLSEMRPIRIARFADGKSLGMVGAVVCEASSLLLSLVLENESPIKSLAPTSLLLKLRVNSSEIASERG
ncbi:hypothetical protein Lal_00001262 [Lupinus albus]|nr:hypothetical protein Lal_00001262 [Lupinus albus]